MFLNDTFAWMYKMTYWKLSLNAHFGVFNMKMISLRFYLFSEQHSVLPCPLPMSRAPTSMTYSFPAQATEWTSIEGKQFMKVFLQQFPLESLNMFLK
jgi:hypothetical protein